MFPSAEPMHVRLEKRQFEKAVLSEGHTHPGICLFKLRLPRLKLWSRPAAFKLQHNLK